MTRISWGSPGSREYESGVDRVVFYDNRARGFPWNGVTALKEEPTDSDISLKHIDGTPYHSQKTKEGFAVMLQAYTCPREFEEYEGTPGILTRQKRKAFGLSYRTRVVNDISGSDYGYKIHIVYNALATVSNVDFNSLTADGLNASPFSWAISTTPVRIPGAKPAAHLIIDTRIAYPEAVQALEDILYGSVGSEARLPDPDELMDLFEQFAILTIIDHGDGTWTAIGPDDVVQMIDDDIFQIDWPSVVYLDEDTYQVSSL